MIEFDISKCKTKAGYSAKLKKGRVLNLKKIIATFNVLLETPILVVIKVDDVEVIVHKHGELYFKNFE